MSFKNEGKIKTFSDKLKMKELTITRPALQEMLKDDLGDWCHDFSVSLLKIRGHSALTHPNLLNSERA